MLFAFAKTPAVGNAAGDLSRFGASLYRRSVCRALDAALTPRVL